MLMGCPRNFTKHGQCGMELSDFLPHLATCADDMRLVRSMHTEAFNHHPGQLDAEHGRADVRPAEHGSLAQLRPGQRSKNLPGYVVLTAGRGTERRNVALVERLPADHLSGRAVPQPGRAGAQPQQSRRAVATNAAQDRSTHCAI